MRRPSLRVHRLALAAGLLLAGTPACYSASGGAAPSPERQSSRAQRATVLTRGDLANEENRPSLYDALVALGWGTRQTSRGALECYVDGQYYGHFTALRDIQVPHVERVRFLSESEAMQIYGSANPLGSGVIEVTTRRS